MSRLVNLNKLTAFSDQSESDHDINSIIETIYPVSYTSDFPEALDEIKDILQSTFAVHVSNAELLSVISRLPKPYDRDIFLAFVKKDATVKVEQECSLFAKLGGDSRAETGDGIAFSSETAFLKNISFKLAIESFQTAVESSTNIDFRMAAKNHLRKVWEDTQSVDIRVIIDKAIQELESEVNENSAKFSSIVRESFKRGLIKYC